MSKVKFFDWFFFLKFLWWIIVNTIFEKHFIKLILNFLCKNIIRFFVKVVGENKG